MIASLCKSISEQLQESNNWSQECHGLVFGNKISIDKGAPVLLPFEWGVEECTNDNFVAPQTSKRSVSWFESEGQMLPVGSAGEPIWATQLTFCDWVNCRLIDKDDQFVVDKLVSIAERNIVDLKNRTLGDHSIARLEIIKIAVGADKILGKYGFSDKAKISSHPYFGYSITFNVVFTAQLCAPISLNPC